MSALSFKDLSTDLLQLGTYPGVLDIYTQCLLDVRSRIVALVHHRVRLSLPNQKPNFELSHLGLF